MAPILNNRASGILLAPLRADLAQVEYKHLRYLYTLKEQSSISNSVTLTTPRDLITSIPNNCERSEATRPLSQTYEL